MTAQEVAIKYLRDRGRKTLYVPVSVAELSGSNCPSTGFRGNVEGMRRLYWGQDCLVAMQSGYAYKLT